MEARPLRTFVTALVLWTGLALSALAASVRTENFIVTTQDPALAQKAAEDAERFRRDLAIEWLGRELPRWPQPCPITIQRDPKLGAGGATTFSFNNGTVFGWRMEIQGPNDELILESVLPHEVNHTIFATYFGQPLPRWADEGACTTVEHDDEQRRMKARLIQFLKTKRGIAFNRMFAMREYPRDVLPLYAQGYSLVHFLVEQGGRQKFTRYVGFGLQTNNWTAATQRFYGYDSLGDLQLTWVDWVAQGSPTPIPSDFTGGKGTPLASGQPQQPHPGDARLADNRDLVPIARNGQPPVGMAQAQANPAQQPAPDRVTPGGNVVRADDEPGWVAIGPRYGRTRSGHAPTDSGAPLDMPEPIAQEQSGDAEMVSPELRPREDLAAEPQGDVLMEWNQQPAGGRVIR